MKRSASEVAQNSGLSLMIALVVSHLCDRKKSQRLGHGRSFSILTK